MTKPSSLDNLFAALADPTRRAIVERLMAHGETTAGALALSFLQGQHTDILYLGVDGSDYLGSDVQGDHNFPDWYFLAVVPLVLADMIC